MCEDVNCAHVECVIERRFSDSPWYAELKASAVERQEAAKARANARLQQERDAREAAASG